eukprot:COSAG05_NODE_14529_length_394_cov_1.054237_1_plen_116_part_10
MRHATGVPSANHCCISCGQLRGCKLWEYSESERSCWLKDNIGAITTHPDRTIGNCDSSPLPPPGPAPPQPPPQPPSAPMNISVSVAVQASFHARPKAALPEFVSFCLDWWHPDEGC